MANKHGGLRSSTVRQLSSVPLQVLLTLNGWYFGGFFIAELLMFVYKGVLLPYPPGNLVLDLMLLFLFLGLEILRIFYGSKGNLCEQTLATVLSVGILVPCAVLSVYFLLLQTFVLRLEVIVNALLLCFYGFELLLCLTGLIAFSRGRHASPRFKFLFTALCVCVLQGVGVQDECDGVPQRPAWCPAHFRQRRSVTRHPTPRPGGAAPSTRREAETLQDEPSGCGGQLL
ncbi:transmembrane protein 216-like [Scleropages formosus]|uniref:Transmembrane protein 216 n=1 Tax=Scleropages formosus TaxID=113540 RepID=A0A0P7TLC2_SCLFO|nr:transmembrane protein 216-like [Scleropages formosus]